VDHIPELGPELPLDVLARRKLLPRKPDDIQLTGERVTLRSDAPADAAELHTISNGDAVARLGRTTDTYDADALIWRLMPTCPFLSSPDLRRFHVHLAALASGSTSGT
jgi:hypothetical protein